MIMAKRRIYFDKSEIVLIVPGKKGASSYNLVSSNVNRIEFAKCKEFTLGFIPKESEMIKIVGSNLPGEIVYKKGENKAYFDTYKEEFAQYCKEYRVPFEDKTQE